MKIGERIKFRAWLSQYGRIREMRAILYQLFEINPADKRLREFEDALEKLSWRVYKHGKWAGRRIGFREGRDA